MATGLTLDARLRTHQEPCNASGDEEWQWPTSLGGEMRASAGRTHLRATVHAHERGLEEPIAALHDALGLRIPRRQQLDRARQRAREHRGRSGEFASSDPGFVVPQQPTRTAPSWVNNSHIPNNRSSLLRVGIITASVNLENAHVITSATRCGCRVRGGSCAAGPTDRIARRPQPSK